MVNYYRDMWIRRSDTLAPLTALMSKEAKWRWTEVKQKAFDTMKKIVSRETLLVYPNFSEPFEIHTDASHTQLGAVIFQRGKPIAFYSRKLNPAQMRYTTTERELLAIVETLKEFRNILLGQQIRVYTDHKNLTHQTFNTERVMRWRLILEEYGPELIYINPLLTRSLMVALCNHIFFSLRRFSHDNLNWSQIATTRQGFFRDATRFKNRYFTNGRNLRPLGH